MIKQNILIVSAICSFSLGIAQQYGGMWIPTELNEKEMKDLGMKISSKDIFNTQKPSIKDAVVHFNGGCTAEVISPKGLLLTNHHCGYSQIQAHSSVQNDLLSNGFWAKNIETELPNPGLTVDFIVDIKDVTHQILDETDNLQDNDLIKKIANNIEIYKNSQKIESYQSISVKPMYEGNKYYAYVMETYKDVRLVGAPPQSIGKFGSDTDNWVWPRHTGDFSMFRIYADKDNKPAEYSKDNVPYVPKYYLPISIKDKTEDDFTFIFGFPGKTTEYLPATAVEKIMKEIDPAKIAVRDVALKTLDEKMRTDNATRIKYSSKYASIANYWKKWIGEIEGLKKSNAIQKKIMYEGSLVAKNHEVKNTLDQLNKLYNDQAPFALNNAYYTEVIKIAETLALANLYSDYITSLEAGRMNEKSLADFKNKLTDFYKNYSADLDAKVSAKLLALYANKTAPQFLPAGFDKYKNEVQNSTSFEELSKNSVIVGKGQVNGAALNGNIEKAFSNQDKLIKAIKKDAVYQLFMNMKDTYMKTADPQFTSLQTKIDFLQKKFMAQQISTDKERKFFPDANSTMRVAYGKVKGSFPRDAVTYGYQTHLKGVIEKNIPGDYEFNVPQKLIDLYNKKDYGNYRDKTGDVPVGFTATNHTTGGNSGSPALDANGNLIGLNFDRQWEGTMSDINYDPNYCRNIMVDTKYILFIIDKFANSKWLLDEMKIVK